jgi:hypothetical protein
MKFCYIGRSLMDILNNKDPKIEPWGRPDSAMKDDEKIPEKQA